MAELVLGGLVLLTIAVLVVRAARPRRRVDADARTVDEKMMASAKRHEAEDGKAGRDRW